MSPEVMYSALCTSAVLCYNLLWKYMGSLYAGFNKAYMALFTDMSLYYPLLIIGVMMCILVSGIMFIGLTIKTGQIVGDVLL